jgi:predicted dehydrogenase
VLLVKQSYGIGILGNCCTHGVGVCHSFQQDQRFKVITGYEANPRRQAELSLAIGQELVTSYQRVIERKDVDIVVITCDPRDKAQMVEAAAAAGKHIFLNKPLCESLDSARQIERTVERYPIQFVYDIPMVRSVPVYARMQQELWDGKYGQILSYYHRFSMNFPLDFDLQSTWPERLDPVDKSGGGELTNMGCYPLDYVVSLFGLPRSVTAKWRKLWDVYYQADVEHFGQVILDYGSFFAVLEIGKQQLVGEHRHSNAITINFEHQILVIDVPAKQVSINNVATDFDQFAKGATATNSLDQLVLAIESDIQPKSNLQNAVRATETLMAVYTSIVEERTVELPLKSGKNPLIS